MMETLLFQGIWTVDSYPTIICMMWSYNSFILRYVAISKTSCFCQTKLSDSNVQLINYTVYYVSCDEKGLKKLFYSELEKQGCSFPPNSRGDLYRKVSEFVIPLNVDVICFTWMKWNGWFKSVNSLLIAYSQGNEQQGKNSLYFTVKLFFM